MEDDVELTRVAHRREADEICFVLNAVGIPTRLEAVVWTNGSTQRYWSVRVPESTLQRARAVVAEEQRQRRPEPQAAAAGRPAPYYWVAGLIVVNICVWLLLEGNGGSEQRETLLRFGAAHAPSIRAGQWWRTLTAVFLHIGALHLLANSIALALLGGPALRQWGPLRFLAIYLAGGLAGNWLSFLLSPSNAVKAGASGAILGLLGALAGRRIREIRGKQSNSRFKTWHVVAMIVAFYGFVVGTGRADHLAHLGGLLAGGLLGGLLPLPRVDTSGASEDGGGKEP